MTDGWHNQGRATALGAAAGLTVVALLLDATYSYDPAHAFASDVTGHEIATAGYVGGFGGSGRAMPAFLTPTKDDGAGAAAVTCSPIAWAGIGVPAGVAVGRLVLVAMSGATSDADAPILASFAISATLKGAAFTITPNAGGLLASP